MQLGPLANIKASQPKISREAIKTLHRNILRLEDDHPHPIGVSTEELLRLIDEVNISEQDREHMKELLEMITSSSDHPDRISSQDYIHFVHNFQEDVLHRNLREVWYMKLIGNFDLWKAGAWNEFDYYTQASYIGGIFGVLAICCVLFSTYVYFQAFEAERNTVVVQSLEEFDPMPTDLGEFMFFVRNASSDPVWSPDVFTLSMSHYVKASNNGETSEEYMPIRTRFVTKANATWWPVGVPDDIVGIVPDEPTLAAGQYFGSSFQQVEVKFDLCTEDCDDTNQLHGGTVNFVQRNSVATSPQFWVLDLAHLKMVDLTFEQKVKTITSKWLLFLDPPTTCKTSIITTASQRDGPRLGDSSTIAFWWLSRGLNQFIEIHNRETILGVFSRLGGLWTSLLTLFGVYAGYYNKKLLTDKVSVLRLRWRYAEDIRIALATTKDHVLTTPNSYIESTV